jgi:hypothetical protein
MGRTGRAGGSSGKLRRELGVDKLLDSTDLDVISRTEREDIHRFAVELNTTREFPVEPRL